MWRKISRELVNEIMREGKKPSVVILCIGNKERGDDAFGPYVARRLKRIRERGVVEVIDCGTVPENYTDMIRRAKPTHVIIVDAVDFKGSPGDIVLSFEPVFDEVSVSTHKPSLALLAKYIKNDIGSRIILLGVQPKSVDWGLSMSEEVLAASEAVVRALRSAIKRIKEGLKKEARA